MTYSEYQSPIGLLTLVATDAGLRHVSWPGQSPDDKGERLPDHPVLAQATTELDEYFAGRRRAFDVPLDPDGTAFQRSAWDVLRTIPYGRTISYAEQARRLGDSAKARAVGAANGRNPISIIVPCHRVVGSSGALTGFAGGLGTKSWLLEFERGVVEGGSGDAATT
ncbi:MAG: methylated-DNA--[protein]-cysteine S-methyltransferase [Candidatus Nanopelagicales bacterium]